MFHVMGPAIMLKPLSPYKKHLGRPELASQNYIDLIKSIQRMTHS